MGTDIELNLSAKEISELEDFLHLGIQMASGLQKNSGVLRKLMMGVIKRIPEGQGLTIGPKKEGTDADACVYFTRAENAETPQE